MTLAAHLMAIEQQWPGQSEEYVVQIDQCVTRRTYRHGQCPCITPQGLFVYKQRQLGGRELLQVQGLSVEAQIEEHFNRPQFSRSRFAQSLAGNSFSFTVISAALYSLLFSYKP